MVVRHFRDLTVWQKSIALAEHCYQMTKAFPDSERYGMTSQIRRAAVSVPANIAEGAARSHTKEFLNYLSIARGSLAELETLLLLSHKVKLLKQSHVDQGLSQIDEVNRMLAGLKRSLAGKET